MLRPRPAAISALATGLLLVPTTAAGAPGEVGTAGPTGPEVRIESVPVTERRAVTTVGPDDQEYAAVELDVDRFNVAAVTWDGGEDVHLTTWMRARTAEGWSDWVEVHDDHHAPDGDETGTDYRAGTEPFITGDADGIEVRVVPEPGEALPDGLQVEVIDPGTTTADLAAAPLEPGTDDVASLDLPPSALETWAPSTPPRGEPTEVTLGGQEATSAASALAAAPSFAVPPQPTIRSRAAWGANETLRRNYGRSIQYGTVRGAFVHHTAGTNSYQQGDVPGIIRGIYHYHVVSRNFYDIGYNFLIDRFGRIWEGAHGGIDRAVVAAHTQWYNSQSFGLSVMGDYTGKEPETAVLTSINRLIAWKLGVHGVTNPTGTANYTNDGARPQPVIAAHRDTKATACPGQRLYNRLGEIRSAVVSRMASVPSHLTLSGPAAMAAGTTRDLTVTWSANGAPVAGTVELQRLAGSSWVPVRQVQVDGVGTTPITPGGSNTYRVHAIAVTAPGNVPATTSSTSHAIALGPTAVTLSAACTDAVMADDGFTDTSGPFVGPIACVRHWGVTNGTSATRYSPRAEVTREQMAAFVARLIVASGGSLPASPGDAFTDDTGSSFQRQINQLAEVGIVRGTGSHSFAPKRAVTRAEMAAFLTRARDYRAALAGLPALPPGPDAFDDDNGMSLQDAINTAAAAGITMGFEDGTFRPRESVRRDHMAAFVMRTLDVVVRDGLSLGPTD